MKISSSFKKTLKKMENVIFIFILYSLFIIITSLWAGTYSNGFVNNFLVNANSSILDFFVLGVILYYFEYKKQKNETISELLEDLENIAKHESIELNIKKIKLIRTLNSQEVYKINMPRMKINNLSTIKHIKFNDAELSGLEMDNSKIRDCSFENCTIQALNLENSTLKNVKFIKCKIKNMKAIKSNFKNTIFIDCQLTGSDFSFSRMLSCTLKSCDLETVNFNQADLRSANLLGSINIDVDKLVNAKNLDYLICEPSIKSSLLDIRGDIKFPNN